MLNNAGQGGVRGKMWEVDTDKARAHFDVNFWGVWNGCKVFAPRLIAQAFESFEGLPHRSQLVAERDGVLFVNDSKATNAASAAQALQAFDSIRWIMGGQMKDGGLDEALAHSDRVAKAYVIGRQARETALMLGAMPHAVCTTMATAVASAAAEAEPGDTVLLAPAGASFDQYDNFEQRGNDFTALVRAL